MPMLSNASNADVILNDSHVIPNGWNTCWQKCVEGSSPITLGSPIAILTDLSFCKKKLLPSFQNQNVHKRKGANENHRSWDIGAL